jgi:HKD family nuclease
MTTELLIPGPAFPARIRHLLGTTSGVDLAVAFVNDLGVALLYDTLVAVLRRKAPVRVLVSLDMNITSPTALQKLKRLEGYQGFELRCFAKNDGFDMLHGKFLVVRNGGTPHVVVGSSNLTGGGYLRNAELNVLLRDQDVATATQDYFDKLWKDVLDGGYSRLLTDDLLAEYKKRFNKTAHLRKALKAKAIPLGKYDDSSVKWAKLVADAKKFRKSAEYQEAVAERKAVITRIRKLLDVPKFTTISDENWKAFYAEQALGHLIPIYRDNIFRHRDELLKMFRLLANETLPIEERWNRALDRHPVKYVGENIMSKVLTVLDPVKYGVWNHPSSYGMKRYGFFAGRNLTPGQRYKAICRFQTKICEKAGIRDNAVLDRWLHQFYWED